MRGRLSLGALGVVLVLAGVLAFVVVSTTGSSSPSTPSFPASSTLRQGTEVPTNFTLDRLGGGSPINLAQAIDHRPAVINLFASWCPSCVAELHAFGSVSSDHRGVVFIGIDTNDPDTQKVLTLLKDAGAHYPVALDTPKLGVASAFGIANLPTTMYVSSSGRLVASVLGPQSSHQLLEHLTGLH